MKADPEEWWELVQQVARSLGLEVRRPHATLHPWLVIARVTHREHEGSFSMNGSPRVISEGMIRRQLQFMTHHKRRAIDKLIAEPDVLAAHEAKLEAIRNGA